MRVLIVAAVLVLSSFHVADAKERLNLHLAFGYRTPLYGSLAERMVAEVIERSGGTLRLRAHEPGALVPRFGYLDAVVQGAVDAAWGTPAVLSGRAPEAALFTGVPFGLAPAEHLAWVRDGPGRVHYDRLYQRFGAVALPCVAVGPDGLAWLRAPLDETAPFRGLRVRAFGLPGRILEALGAGVATGFGADLMIGLRTGAFEAAEGSVPAADVAFGLHTVSTHYLYPSPIQPATLLDLVFNAGRWEALTADHRAAFDAACRATATFAEGAARAADAAALGRIAGAEVAIAQPSAAVEMALHAAWQQVRDRLAADTPAFAAVVAAYPAAPD